MTAVRDDARKASWPLTPNRLMFDGGDEFIQPDPYVTVITVSTQGAQY